MRKSVAKRIRLIKRCRSYSTTELADLMGVHPRTIQQWQKRGMPAIDPECKPFLFMGQATKEFLQAKRRSAKRPLQDGEFYCTGCRQPRKSVLSGLSVHPLRPSDPLCKQLHIKGKCSICGHTVNRFLRADRLSASVFGTMLKEAEERLTERPCALVNADMIRSDDDE